MADRERKALNRTLSGDDFAPVAASTVMMGTLPAGYAPAPTAAASSFY